MHSYDTDENCLSVAFHWKGGRVSPFNEKWSLPFLPCLSWVKSKLREKQRPTDLNVVMSCAGPNSILSSPFCPLHATYLMSVFLSTGPTVSGLLVKGEVGQNVTVPCFYRVKTEYDITSMCWGRDACPASKCSQPIIWTDGRKVTERHHTKYVLKGDLLKGNVSLTILNAQETDSGTYCCRVEIPGWFNDETTNLQVVVERGECCSVWSSKLMEEVISVIICKISL